MTLTLEVSAETAQRVERAIAHGINIETLLCGLLEGLITQTENVDPMAHPITSLAGKYEGDAWDEFLAAMEKNRSLDAVQHADEK